MVTPLRPARFSAGRQMRSENAEPFSGEDLSLAGKAGVAGLKSSRASCRRLFTAIVGQGQVAFFPATGADDDQLRDAPARVTRPLRPGGVDVERRPDDKAATGRQGVPVVLPVREGSPGGSYGNGGRGARLCPALFPVGLRRIQAVIATGAVRSLRSACGRLAACGAGR